MQRLAVDFGLRNRFTEAEFNRLFLEHYSQITAAAFRLVEDTGEAEELASEAFWKLWQSPPRSSENVLGWLYRVVVNLGYNRLRSARRRNLHETSAILDALAASQSDELPAEIERRQDRQQVRAILARLPERDVQLLILHALEMPYKEIAAALRINPNSVGTLLARAEHKFENLYHQEENHAPQR